MEEQSGQKEQGSGRYLVLLRTEHSQCDQRSEMKKEHDLRRGQKRDYILHDVADCVIVFIYHKSNRKP